MVTSCCVDFKNDFAIDSEAIRESPNPGVPCSCRTIKGQYGEVNFHKSQFFDGKTQKITCLQPHFGERDRSKTVKLIDLKLKQLKRNFFQNTFVNYLHVSVNVPIVKCVIKGLICWGKCFRKHWNSAPNQAACWGIISLTWKWWRNNGNEDEWWK